ncbi:MAG: exodeoxyribonuclease VII small subunit [Gammaproteobacteria bacterium]|nr:exodeoxyribonuclease VII small subunit [Gammaproteobacteria bacterium]
MPPSKKRATPGFETSLAELEALVVQMERGEMTLEESLQTFERGTALARECQTALREAEQKVQLLTQVNGNEQLIPMPPGAHDPEALDPHAV